MARCFCLSLWITPWRFDLHRPAQQLGFPGLQLWVDRVVDDLRRRQIGRLRRVPILDGSSHPRLERRIKLPPSCFVFQVATPALSVD